MPTQSRHDLLVQRRLLAGEREERFQRIVRLAARLIGTPVALLNLLDETTSWTKAAVGYEGSSMPVDETFCKRVVSTGSAQEIPDLRDDDELQQLALVTEAPHFRFYAGEPLRLDDRVIGTLCVIDTAPRTLTPDQRDLLHELSTWAQAELDNADLNDLLSALRDREARLSALLDAVPEAVLLVDDDLSVTAANPVGDTALGAQSRPLAEVFPRLDVEGPPFRERRGEVAPDTVGLPVETSMQTATGLNPVEVSVAHLAQGEWCYLVLVRDLADLAKADAAVRRQQRVTSLILDSTAEGVVASNADGSVLLANRAATQLLTCRASDLIGRRFDEVARPERDPQGQLTLSRRDGSRFPVEHATSPIEIGGELVGYVDTFRDITQRLGVERLKDEFVGVVSHELRTPLTSITGALGLLASGAFGEIAPEQAELVTLARNNADRLGLLVNDILDLDRLDAGRLPLDPVTMDAADLAARTVAALQGAARSAEVTLELVGVAAGSEATLVNADPVRIGQALSNLVGNAIKFSSSGGRVTVTVRRDEDGPDGPQVVLAVTDEGPGIPEDQQAKVFDRFHQVDPRERGSRTGSGLGLSIASGIVERSGGRLWLTSTVGEGSTFGMSLPAAARS